MNRTRYLLASGVSVRRSRTYRDSLVRHAIVSAGRRWFRS